MNKQIVLERAAFKNAVISIYIRNKGVLNIVPVAAQKLQGFNV